MEQGEAVGDDRQQQHPGEGAPDAAATAGDAGAADDTAAIAVNSAPRPPSAWATPVSETAIAPASAAITPLTTKTEADQSHPHPGDPGRGLVAADRVDLLAVAGGAQQGPDRDEAGQRDPGLGLDPQHSLSANFWKPRKSSTRKLLVPSVR